MGLKSFWKTYKRYRRQKKSGLTFPVLTKIHGVKTQDRQGALAQSASGDKLQLVHVALPDYPYNVYVYSVTLNRILGYLDVTIAKNLFLVFGDGFCLDGTLDDILGGPPLKYRGARVRIYDDNVFMQNEIFSTLYEQ